MITDKDLTLLYITAYEGSGGWRRNSEATDRAMKKIMEDIVEREIRAKYVRANWEELRQTVSNKCGGSLAVEVVPPPSPLQIHT